MLYDAGIQASYYQGGFTSDIKLRKFIGEQIVAGYLEIRHAEETGAPGTGGVAQEQQIVHSQCIRDFASSYAYLLFLDLENYLLLTSANSTERGQLTELLSQEAYRYSPGARLHRSLPPAVDNTCVGTAQNMCLCSYLSRNKAPVASNLLRKSTLIRLFLPSQSSALHMCTHISMYIAAHLMPGAVYRYRGPCGACHAPRAWACATRREDTVEWV